MRGCEILFNYRNVCADYYVRQQVSSVSLFKICAISDTKLAFTKLPKHP